MAKPPTIVDLTWTGGLTLAGSSGNAALTLDSAGLAGPSPVQALGLALAGCMTMDVVHLLTKGRHAFRALRSHLVAERSQSDPHRFLTITLHFIIEGNVPAAAVERAIALSREKYCSVWHSMRQDVPFTVAHDIRP